MKKNILFQPDWKALGFTALGALCLLSIGTFYDLQISQTLYRSQTLFEQIGYCYGPLPLFWVFTFFGYATVYALRPFSWWKQAAGWLLCLVAAAASCWYIISHAAPYFDNSWLNNLLGLGLTIIPPFLFLWKIRSRYSRWEIWKYSFLCLLAAGSAFLCTTILKHVVLRPRYRAILANEGLSYKPWYSLAKPYEWPGMDKDLIYSFPSGHTTAASPILLASLPWTGKKRTTAWLLGIVWIVLTALSRIVAGAHFLSDVSFALLIFSVCFALTFKLYDFFEKTKRT